MKVIRCKNDNNKKKRENAKGYTKRDDSGCRREVQMNGGSEFVVEYRRRTVA
jgi:hypothetical protein